MRRPVLLGLVAVLVAGIWVAPVAGVQAQEPADGAVRIEVLSNRADLVSGSDALVDVVLPEGAGADRLLADVDGDVTHRTQLPRLSRQDVAPDQGTWRWAARLA